MKTWSFVTTLTNGAAYLGNGREYISGPELTVGLSQSGRVS
jgi:hypothetical protein